MRYTSGESHLTSQALECKVVIAELLRQKHERDRLPELEVIGAVDLAHRTVAEALNDAVALAEYLTGDKSASDEGRSEAGGVGRAVIAGSISRRRTAGRSVSPRRLGSHS